MVSFSSSFTIQHSCQKSQPEWSHQFCASHQENNRTRHSFRQQGKNNVYYENNRTSRVIHSDNKVKTKFTTKIIERVILSGNKVTIMFTTKSTDHVIHSDKKVILKFTFWKQLNMPFIQTIFQVTTYLLLNQLSFIQTLW